MPAEYYETHHNEPGFSYPTQDELLAEIDAGYDRGALSKETAYILLHLIRTMCREDEELAGESDMVVGEMVTCQYAWERVVEQEADLALAKLQDDGYKMKVSAKDGSLAMECAK